MHKRISIGLLLFTACASPRQDEGHISGVDEALVSGASASVDRSEESEVTPTGSGDEYVFVWLKTGPATDLDADERSAAFAGHFANIERLAKEQFLLIAGPVGDPKADSQSRGIFLFDVDQVSKAEKLTASDPSVQAGVFVFDARRFNTSQPLRSLVELEKHNAKDQEGMRSYVIATSNLPKRADAALQPFKDEGLIVLSGRLGERETEHGLYIIQVETVEEARELLELAGDAEALDWQVSSLYASKMIAEVGE